MEKPLVSIIIPTHNSEKTVSTAIESMLGQTYQNTEIIVVDDNSTDKTKEVVENLSKKDTRVRYFKLPFDDPHRFGKNGRNINAGYMARNYGLEQVRGEWITFQDADDASFKNRIEVQYMLAQKYDSNHICTQWQKYNDSLVNKVLDVERIISDNPKSVMNSEEIEKIRIEAKGIIPSLFGQLHRFIPFELKTARIFNKLFFGSLESYPGSGNSPLFKKEITDKVKFRKRDERVWPSFTGRGADRDFNFQISETFEKSFSFNVPIYLWRVNRDNPDFIGYDKYIK